MIGSITRLHHIGIRRIKVIEEKSQQFRGLEGEES